MSAQTSARLSIVVGDYKRGMAPRLSVTNLIAGVVFWFVFGTGILLALATLQIPLLDSAIATVVRICPTCSRPC